MIMLIASTGCGTGTEKFEYKYDAEEIVRPIWETDVIYNETVLLLEETPGGVASGKLRFTPKEILSIRDSSLKYEFKEGTDWEYKDGKICRIDGSVIPYFTEKNTYGEELYYRNFNPETGELSEGIPYDEDAQTKFQTVDGEHTAVWLEDTTLLEHLINVTYRYDPADYTGPKQQYEGDRLPRLQQKIENGEEIKMLVLGDSIACGGSSSGNKNIEPYMGSFYDLLGDAISRKSGAACYVDNQDAMGGQISDYSLAKIGNLTRAQISINRFQPDVVLIHWGMNDGTWGCTPERYRSNLIQIISDCKAINDQLEFIIVGTCMPNDNGCCYVDAAGNRTPVYGYQPYYSEACATIPSEERGTVFVDAGEIHRYFLAENKKFLDMTASGINHPNDFVIRLYAMNLVKAIIK